MVKYNRGINKLFMTYYELCQRNLENNENNYKTKINYLPFNYCSLSLHPFNNPVCDEKGNIFEKKYIINYLSKYHKNPIDYSQLSIKNLITLNFYKGNNNKLCCPITLKEYSENTKIVIIKETGNVYSYEAYLELNKNIKNFKDLLNDQKFDPKNVIIINDPNNKKIINNFKFIKNKEELDYVNNLIYNNEEILNEKKENVNLPSNYKKIIEDYEKDNSIEKIKKLEIIEQINLGKNYLDKEYLNKIKKNYEENFLPIFKLLKEKIKHIENLNEIKNLINFNSNIFLFFLKENNLYKKYLKSNENSPNFDELRNIYYNIIKKSKMKGYVKFYTNFGNLNIEIFSDLVPFASENFIELCEENIYLNKKFNRLLHNCSISIENFDIKENYFGKLFNNENNNFYSHNEKGLLCMINNEKNVNNYKFLITLSNEKKDEKNKNTIFGKILDDLKILDIFNSIKTENTKPIYEIKINKIEIYKNPFREVIKDLIYNEIKLLIENEKKIEIKNENKKDEKNYLNKKRERK